MKSTIRAVVVLFIAMMATPLFALQRNVVDDVIKMSHSGVSEDTLIAFVQKTNERFDVSADDVIRMTDANVPKAVVHAVVEQSEARVDGRHDRTAVVVAPTYVDPYYYDPYYYYDPFWYGFGPRLSLNLGFGRYYGGHFGGGHFGGGHWGGGHFHGRH